jgi:RNA polymerase sigma-70 factor (ECF subfamily)
MHPPDGFHELVERARAGDGPAMERLLAHIRPWLDGLVRGRPEATDLAQEAWLRAWQKLDQFEGGADDEQTWALFRAWLARIVERLGLNAARGGRARKRRPPGGSLLPLADALAPGGSNGAAREPAAADPTPSAAAAAAEQARRVREALQALPDDVGRTILLARFTEGLSLREIARRLQVSHEHVRAHYHAALRRLERELGGPP